MPFFFLRPSPQRFRRLPFQVLLTVAPLVALSARSEAAPALGATAPQTASVGLNAPQITDAIAPNSAIATSKAPVPTPRLQDARALMVSMPDPAPVALSPLKPPSPAAATTLRATPRLVAKSAVPSTPTSANSISSAPRLTSVAALAPALDEAPPRQKAARLPARGGLILKPAPVELRPERNAAPALSDSQRLLLARLDADLGRAQRRLNRAESRLSEGQRQLGSATGLLRNAMLEAGDDGRGLNPFVRVAQRYLGTPYVWGGESARGFDCSGFIMRVMRDLGYQALPHSAAEQFRYGTPVAKELLKAGDIVFFANTYKPGVSHVGIYLGRGRFIHAANSQDGTIVSSLHQPKWMEKYAGARRLVPLNS